MVHAFVAFAPAEPNAYECESEGEEDGAAGSGRDNVRDAVRGNARGKARDEVRGEVRGDGSAGDPSRGREVGLRGRGTTIPGAEGFPRVVIIVSSIAASERLGVYSVMTSL